jgi:hypothetical protein
MLVFGPRLVTLVDQVLIRHDLGHENEDHISNTTPMRNDLAI